MSTGLHLSPEAQANGLQMEQMRAASIQLALQSGVSFRDGDALVDTAMRIAKYITTGN